MKLLWGVLLLTSVIKASGLPSVVGLIGMDERLSLNGFSISDSLKLASRVLDSNQVLSFQIYYQALPQIEPFEQKSQTTELLWWQSLNWTEYKISLGWVNSQLSYSDSLMGFYHNENEVALNSALNFNHLIKGDLGFELDIEKYYQRIQIHSKWNWETRKVDVTFRPVLEYSQFNIIEELVLEDYNLDLQSMGATWMWGSDLGLALGRFRLGFGFENEQSLKPKTEVLADLLSQSSWGCRQANCVDLKKESQKFNGLIGLKLYRDFILNWEYKRASTGLVIQNSEKSNPFSETDISYESQKVELLSRSLKNDVVLEFGLEVQSISFKQLPVDKEYILESEFFPVEGGEVLFSLFQKERWKSLSSIEYIGFVIPFRLRCLPKSWEEKGYYVSTELNPFLDLFQYKSYLENQKVLSLLFASTEVKKDEISPLWAVYGFHPKIELGYQNDFGSLSVYFSQYIPVYHDVWKVKQDFTSIKANLSEKSGENSEASGGTKFGLRYTIGL